MTRRLDEHAFLFMIGLPSCVSQPASDEEIDTESPVSRFVARLLSFLLQGFEARNKNVRFRSVNVVAEMIAHLGELEYVLPSGSSTHHSDQFIATAKMCTTS